MDEGVKGIKIPHRILDLVQLLPFVILIILYRYPLPYEVNSTVFASKSYKTLEAPRYIMNFTMDWDGFDFGAACNAPSDTLYDPNDNFLNPTHPLALSRRLQHQVSVTSNSCTFSSGPGTISPHLLLLPPAEVSAVSAVDTADESSDDESDIVASSRAASSRSSSPVPSCTIQAPFPPPSPPSPLQSRASAQFGLGLPFVRRSERLFRPTSQVRPPDTSPPDSDDSGDESEFQPEPYTPPPKRGGGARRRSSVPSVAPPTPKPPTSARKWPRRDGEARQLQNKTAQAKYRHKKKAISEAESKFGAIVRRLLDTPSPSGRKIKDLMAERRLHDLEMNAINERFA